MKYLGLHKLILILLIIVILAFFVLAYIISFTITLIWELKFEKWSYLFGGKEYDGDYIYIEYIDHNPIDTFKRYYKDFKIKTI